MSAPPKMSARESGTEDGVEWAIVDAPLYDAVNGYARVPDGHPWHGLGYDEIDVEVHGGLTYADEDWIGFDTLHLGDYWPGCPPFYAEMSGPTTRWTAGMVADEARALARAVAKAAS